MTAPCSRCPDCGGVLIKDLKPTLTGAESVMRHVNKRDAEVCRLLHAQRLKSRKRAAFEMKVRHFIRREWRKRYGNRPIQELLEGYR